MLKFISRFNRRHRPSILKNNQLLFFPPKEFITSLLLYNIFLIIIYMKKISQFWLAESSAVLTKYSAKIENTVQFEILTIFVIKHIVLLLSFWQMFFRQSLKWIIYIARVTQAYVSIFRLKHGHIHSANQNPVFLCSIFHLLF